jgi:hypothetical protein
MTLNWPGWKTKAIFHPTIFGATCWPTCAPHPIEKSLWEVLERSLSLSENKSCNKNT